MAYRKVFGTIHTSQDTPWEGAKVVFILQQGSYTPANQYPKKRVVAVTDATGYFEADLWCSAEGIIQTRYLCRLPGDQEFEFVLPIGGDINLSTLRGGEGLLVTPIDTIVDLLDPYFLTQAEGDGRYALAGGVGSPREVLTYSPSNIYNLQGQPSNPAKALFFVNGAKQVYGVDFTINNTVLAWVSSSLQLAVNDTIEIYY